MTKKPIVSIIFPAKNEGNHVKETLQSLFSVKTHVTFEAIVVDDHSDDGCCHFLKHPSSFQGVKLIETKGLEPLTQEMKELNMQMESISYFVMLIYNLNIGG